jgi:hypothetical protein
MCWRSYSEHDRYGRTSATPRRSLLAWLRDLLRPRRPQLQDAEVIPFPTQAAATPAREAERKRSEAA